MTAPKTQAKYDGPRPPRPPKKTARAAHDSGGKLKWFCGMVIHFTVPLRRQKKVYVAASSRKRAQVLLKPFTHVSLYEIGQMWTCVDAPPDSLAGQPVEEGVWIEREPGEAIIRADNQ